MARLNPELGARAAVARVPTRVDQMRPGNRFLRALDTIPVVPGVAAHSIIPVRAGGPPEKGDDGVVAYRSAHIDGVESELVVRWGHSVPDQPEAIEEVRPPPRSSRCRPPPRWRRWDGGAPHPTARGRR